MKKMKITVRKDGTQKVEVLNASGDECLAFTKEMERRLGTQDGERELKPEFEQAENVEERNYERGS